MPRLQTSWVPFVTVVLLAACSPAEQTQTEQDRRAEEYAKSFGIDATASSNPDGTKTVAVDRSMGGLAVQSGSNLSLPAGFPDDIPMYPQINIVAASQLPGQGFMVQGQTADAMQQVADFYIAQLGSSSWTQESAQQTPPMQALTFKKGNRTATVNLIAGQGTTIHVTTMVMP